MDRDRTVGPNSRRQEGAHEGPVVPQHTTAFVPDSVRFDEIGVDAEQAPVFLVRGEAGKAEQGERLVTGTLTGQEVAMVSAAVLIDQFEPAAGEAFEGVDLRRIDDVLHHTSNHDRA